MLEKLRGESGVDFSKDYNEMQLKPPQGGRCAVRGLCKERDNPALKNGPKDAASFAGTSCHGGEALTALTVLLRTAPSHPLG